MPYTSAGSVIRKRKKKKNTIEQNHISELRRFSHCIIVY